MEPGADLIGRVIAGKYSVRSVIGHGAMGIVYCARQIALDKVIALKVLSAELRDDPEFVLRFHTEARAASRLDHPNSTRVLDFGEEPDGLLYIAMELLEGRTLADLLDAEYPLAPARVASIMSQALSAVGAAHALKILHRDLKPENIVILDGRDDEDRPVDVVKVCDFGIAKLEGGLDQVDGARLTNPGGIAPAWGKLKNATSVGSIVGTPQYMSPEQTRGDKLDVRSDLYSLGVVLFEMLTRRAPFEGTPAEVLYQHSEVAPPTPSSIHPGVDPRLEAICMRALEKNRDERFATAREMRLALRPVASDASEQPSQPLVVTPHALASSLQGATSPTISATAVTPRARRAGRAAWLAVPLIAAIAAGAFVFVHRSARRPVSLSSPPTAEPITATPAPTESESSAPVLASASATERLAAPPPAPTVRIVERVARVESTTHAAPEPVATGAIVSDVPEPPPAPTATTSAPQSPAVPVVAPAVARADPARAHVEIGPIRAERVGNKSVESVVRHVDLAGCYRTEVAQMRQADGTATLVLDMDEERVIRADLVGGAFAASLRQCIARRVMGARVTNVDTGAASAKVTLRFLLQ